MTTGTIVLTKYVFLDIVAYTKRTIEAQCYVIGALNRIVKGAVNRYHVEENSLVYIPTGDGICIALISTNLTYDIHVKVAKEILRRIHVNNSRVREDWKKFEVRVGMNQCDDNMVTDINGGRNVAGAGINNARRIMDLADGSQILVSSTVYETLHHRKEYNHAFSSELTKEVKHGLVLRMHQLITPNTDGLNVNTPSIFITQVKVEPRLTKLAAYYFAHAIKNREFIICNRGDGINEYALGVLLFFLANDSLGKAESTLVNPYDERMPETQNNTLNEQYQLFESLPFWVCCYLRDFICETNIRSENHKFFEDNYQCTLVNEEGQKKLKRDWPEICEEFGLV